MTPRSREVWAPRIRLAAVAWGVGFASSQEIDTIGILPATKLAPPAPSHPSHHPLYLLPLLPFSFPLLPFPLLIPHFPLLPSPFFLLP